MTAKQAAHHLSFARILVELAKLSIDLGRRRHTLHMENDMPTTMCAGVILKARRPGTFET